MADTKPVHTGGGPVAEDGVSFRGIGWFVVILTATTLACAALMWGLLAVFQHRDAAASAGRAPLSAEPVTPDIRDGRIVGGAGMAGPDVLVNEPTVLDEFRRREDAVLTSYGWVDRNAGVARIPIDRAKALLLERGLPVREGAAPGGGR